MAAPKATPEELAKAEAEAKKHENDPEIEMAWAIKAFQYAETYEKLIKVLPDSRDLRLTKRDDDLYAAFREHFPDMNIENIDVEAMKSEEGKAKWRPILESFKGDVMDYNYATLLRVDGHGAHDEKNTIVVPRVQFLMIEIARKRQGINNGIKK